MLDSDGRTACNHASFIGSKAAVLANPCDTNFGIPKEDLQESRDGASALLWCGPDTNPTSSATGFGKQRLLKGRDIMSTIRTGRQDGLASKGRTSNQRQTHDTQSLIWADSA